MEEVSFESSDEALWSSSGWGPSHRRLCGWDRKQTHGRGLCVQVQQVRQVLRAGSLTDLSEQKGRICDVVT